LRKKIENAFTVLAVEAEPGSGNYGILDSMTKLEKMKERMVGWAEAELWYPVIA
jgi:hypothetical protein